MLNSTFSRFAVIALLAASAWSQEGKPAPAPAPVQDQAVTDAAVVAQQKPSYPLTTCPVSGKELDAKSAQDVVVAGRLVRTCCGMCAKGIKQDPKAAIAKVDAGVVAAQKASYPLETCVVSGEKLGSMGEAVDVVHGTRLVRLCCAMCKKSFEKSPDASMKKIDAALIEKQKASYPLTKCVVSGEPLDAMGKPVDVLYGTRLVRLCCKMCTKSFEADPAKHVAQIDAAAKAK